MPKVDRNNPKVSDASESTFWLMEFVREFGDDAACLEHLWRSRVSPDGWHAHCSHCEASKVPQGRQASRMVMRLHADAMSPLAGTIFAKSATSLHLWFYVMSPHD